MITDTVVLNKDETSSMVMSWAHDMFIFIMVTP